MKQLDERINLADIAFLQAYLISIFQYENECAKDFNHTEWYLNQKLSRELKEIYMDFIKSRGAKCDCDVLHKIDLKNEDEFYNLVNHND